MGNGLPIIAHQCCELSTSELELAAQIAAGISRRRPNLRIDPLFDDLVPDAIVDATSLHVDDLSEIQNIESYNSVFFQERARLRALKDELVATALPQIDGYEPYCQNYLGLGPVEWIQPNCGDRPLRLAEACWEDRGVRRELVHRIRTQGMRYVHPHMGSRATWELALLLSQASHRPVEVIAPPPAVTAYANDKGAFARLVKTIFGTKAMPANSVVWNTATAAKRLQELSDSSARMVALKLPKSSSGEGNLLIPIADIRHRNLREIDAMLDERLPELHYESGDELLVTQWVDEIVATPSAQLWIPPTPQGLPILEGMFMQVIEGEQGFFSGFRPAYIPRHLQQQLTRQCLQLARVYQLLGYIGRCSFDMLLIGSEMETSKLEFIECNGRWGGTSLPMTLMNRVFGDWEKQPFASRTLRLGGANRLPFLDVLSALDDELFRRDTNRGKLVLLNPQRTAARGEVSVLMLHDNWETTVGPRSDELFDACANRLRRASSESNAVHE